MRTGLIALAVVASLGGALLAGCGQSAPGQAAVTADMVREESKKLTEFLDAKYEVELLRSPERLTQLGRREKYDQLDDATEKGDDEDLAVRKASVEEMRSKFDYAKLDDEAKTSFDMWARGYEFAELRHKYRRNMYVFGRDGAHTGLPNFLINFHKVESKTDMEALIKRIGAVPTVIDALVERAKAGAKDGVRMPRFAYEKALKETKAVASGQPFAKDGPDSPLWADVKSKAAALVKSGAATEAESKAWLDQAREALTGKMGPAYGRLAAWLEADMKDAPAEPIGAGKLPDGPNYYKAALEWQTTTDLSPEQIHETGLKEVARIRGEMEKVKEQVGFKGTLEEFFVQMRTDKRFYLPNTDEGRAKYLSLADGYLTAMKAKLPQYFGILPKADLVVKRVEAFREEAGGAQHYMAGTPDGKRPGVFYAHLSDMNAEPTYQLENIAYHEGLPGHHMQISIAQELTGLPKFRTQYHSTAYIEGWGLYSEALAKEMGFDSDPYNDFGRLSGEIWRAVRMVVDTGIHSKGWSEEQAVQYFLSNSAQPEAAVRSEIRRYILWPGQATCYKIGMMKIQDLRKLAQNELGPKFDIKAFHDVVLGGGAMPLPVLEKRVRRWIERTKG